MKGMFVPDITAEEFKNGCLEAVEALIAEGEVYDIEYPLQRWIPVNERLPELNERVLVTSYGRVCYAMMTSKDANCGYPVFKLQDSLNERVVCETTVHSEFTTSRIKAWMPLPEPYKGDDIEY